MREKLSIFWSCIKEKENVLKDLNKASKKMNSLLVMEYFEYIELKAQ